VQKMKQFISEIKRFQQLAGLIKENDGRDRVNPNNEYVKQAVDFIVRNRDTFLNSGLTASAKEYYSRMTDDEIKDNLLNNITDGQIHRIVANIKANQRNNKPQMSETIFGSQDVNTILKKAKLALELGDTVTVDGKEIAKIVPAAGAFIPADGSPSLRIKDYIGNMGAIKINGQPMELKPYEPKPSNNTSKGTSNSDWSDRYGPNGGYETSAGRYTGD